MRASRGPSERKDAPGDHEHHSGVSSGPSRFLVKPRASAWLARRLEEYIAHVAKARAGTHGSDGRRIRTLPAMREWQTYQNTRAISSTRAPRGGLAPLQTQMKKSVHDPYMYKRADPVR